MLQAIVGWLASLLTKELIPALKNSGLMNLQQDHGVSTFTHLCHDSSRKRLNLPWSLEAGAADSGAK
jgi:hypothetical protein